jgi:hypothetical protein
MGQDNIYFTLLPFLSTMKNCVKDIFVRYEYFISHPQKIPKTIHFYPMSTQLKHFSNTVHTI